MDPLAAMNPASAYPFALHRGLPAAGCNGTCPCDRCEAKFVTARLLQRGKGPEVPFLNLACLRWTLDGPAGFASIPGWDINFGSWPKPCGRPRNGLCQVLRKASLQFPVSAIVSVRKVNGNEILFRNQKILWLAIVAMVRACLILFW